MGLGKCEFTGGGTTCDASQRSPVRPSDKRRTNVTTSHWRGRDSSVYTATSYGLDGPGIESRWGRGFPHPSRPALRPTQPPVHWVPGLSRAQRGRGVALTTHSI